MPKVTGAHLEARRQQILDAASACFSRQGFHQTTMQDICREAHLSPGAVYRYFASKEAIIAASCQNCYQQHLAYVQAAMQGNEDPLEVLDQLIDTGFHLLEGLEAQEEMRMNIQLWAEALRSPEIMEGFQRANFDVWRTALTELVVKGEEKGEINPSLDPESAARVLLSAWHGLVLQKGFDPDVNVPKYLEALKAMYRGAFAMGVVK